MTATGGGDAAGGPNPDARRGAFGAWRRARPFWGGLLMLLAGIELLAIPLSGVLIKGQVKLVIYIGIGGVSGVLIGVLLAAAGIVVWANPAHRVFYGAAGTILGIASFPASNLGGFFIGMLMAITGGGLAFAWTPGGPSSGRHQGRHRVSGSGCRVLALAGLPCLIFCASPPVSPSSAPSASRSTLPSAPVPVKAGKVAPPPSAMLPSRSKKAGRSQNGPVKQVSSPPGLIAPSTASVLTARSSTLTNLNFVGVTTLPVGGGGREKVLEFTASSAILTSVGITIRQSGHTVLTTTRSLSMPGGMTLYTTKMCGQVEGIVPSLCFTPDTASQVPLKLASALGQVTPVTMTGVTADQFINVAATSRWGTLSLGTG